jgi:2-amino-4-hydroxy-6-hydroxymethyldihydropteridine diphosphokinase
MNVTDTRTALAAIALGANQGDRQATLTRALELLAAELGLLAAVSGWLETEALIHPDDPTPFYPPYLNGVALLRTSMAPHDLLLGLQSIERRLGRDRRHETARWRPRTIDLDLVAFDDEILSIPDLVLPHPEMHKRAFVLGPMAEVWPDWRHPRLGLTVREMLEALG